MQNSSSVEEVSRQEHTADETPAASDGDTQCSVLAVVAMLGNSFQTMSNDHTTQVQALAKALEASAEQSTKALETSAEQSTKAIGINAKALETTAEQHTTQIQTLAEQHTIQHAQSVQHGLKLREMEIERELKMQAQLAALVSGAPQLP